MGNKDVEESPRLAHPRRKQNRDDAGARDMWSACNDGEGVRYVCAILEPIKAHVDGFGAALFDCVIDNASSTTVVNLKGCRWLGMAHFFQDDTEDNSFAGIEETCAEFCFGGGGQDDVEDGA
eukprot:scaffold113843_cov57-Attheya_sp.AAC.1